MKAARRWAWLLALPALAGCGGGSPLQGQWAVDLDGTVAQARRDGIPAQAAPQIREVFAHSRIEITEQTLRMRASGMPEAVARNYRVVGEQAGCYRLEIVGRPGAQEYCLRGPQLLVRDPTTPLTVVYRRVPG